MIKFITDITSKSEMNILEPVKDKNLLIVSLEGQLLGSFEPPKNGWTHDDLCEKNKTFPKEWNVCGADALLGEQWVGSTEV